MIIQNCRVFRRLMNDLSAMQGLCLEILESQKDFVKEWMKSDPMSFYGYFMQFQLCDKV